MRFAKPARDSFLFVWIRKEWTPLSGVPNARKLDSCMSLRATNFLSAQRCRLSGVLQLLNWARDANALIIEDDYDSEFRFSGRPVPALQGLDRHGSVIYLGTFNKVLFTSLRLGYMVVPESLLDRLLAFRMSVDRFPAALPQAILCDFLSEGHFGRHLRRMRELYASRLAAFHSDIRRYVDDILQAPDIQAGLNTPVYLTNGHFLKAGGGARRAEQHRNYRVRSVFAAAARYSRAVGRVCRFR